MKRVISIPTRYSTPAQKVAFIAGAVYFVTALAGFALIGVGHFPLLPKATLIIFGINPLHNSLHMAVALVWIYCARSHELAKRSLVIIGVTFGLLTITGMLNLLGFLGVNGISDPDNFLHLLTAMVALYFGTAGADSAKGAALASSAVGDRPAQRSWWD